MNSHKEIYIKLSIIILGVALSFCKTKKDTTNLKSLIPIKWEERTINFERDDSLLAGSTYLPVYSRIYSMSGKRSHELTITVSMRNLNKIEKVFIQKVNYIDTNGKLIKTYFKKPIYILPLETVEFILIGKEERKRKGAGIYFDWWTMPGSMEPYFEGIMISTSGQQGLSFTTHGKRIK